MCEVQTAKRTSSIPSANDRYKKPETRCTIKKQANDRYKKTETKCTIKKQANDRYKKPETRCTIKKQANDRYKKPETKCTIKKQANNRYKKPETGSTIKKQANDRYKKAEKKTTVKQQSKDQYKRQQERISHNPQMAIILFEKSCIQYPEYICAVCNCFKFRYQVVNFNKGLHIEKSSIHTKITKEYPKTQSTKISDQEYMCLLQKIREKR